MFRPIFLHQLRQNLQNDKFTLLLVLSIALTLIITPLVIQDYRDRLQAYDLRLKEDARNLQATPAYSALEIAVHKRPSPLAAFSQGIEA